MWREESHPSGLSIPLFAGNVAGADGGRLELYARLSHPALVPIRLVRRAGDVLEVGFAPCRLQTGEGGAGDGADLARAVLVAVFGHALPVTDLRPVSTRLGRRRFLPPPLWQDSPGAAACAVPDSQERVCTLALLVQGLEEELDLVRGAVRSASNPRALVFTGPDGSGRSTLLRLVAVDLGRRGADVEWGVPGRPAASARALVVLLDDLDPVASRQPLARLKLAAERLGRPLLVVATAAGDGGDLEVDGLSVEAVRMRPVGDADLRAAVIAPGVPASDLASAVEHAVSGASGNPLVFRLLLEEALDGARCDGAEEALLGRVLRLEPAARRTLAAAAVLASDLTEERARLALGQAPAWDGLDGLVEDCGERPRLICAELGATALAHAGPVRELHRGAARALAGVPELGLRRADHWLRAGEPEAARAAAREGLAAADPAVALVALEGLQAAGLDLGVELRLAVGELHVRGGRPERGRCIFEQLAREADRPDVQAIGALGLADLQARRGQLAEARATLAGIAPEVSGADPTLAARIRFLDGFVLLRCGALAEARSAYESGLEPGHDLPEEVRAEGLSGLGQMLVREPGGSRRGDRLLAEARVIYQRLDRPDRLSRVLSREGSALARRGDLDGALLRHLEALESSLVAEDRTGSAECHVDIASVAFDRGELRRAERHLRAARCGFEAAGDARAVTLAAANLAAVATELGRPQAAIPVLLAALEADRACGARIHLAHDLRLLGQAARLAGDLAQAGERLAEALALFRDLEDEHGLAETQLGVARLALDRGEAAAARAAAESGLRALAPTSGSLLATWLSLTAARAEQAMNARASGSRLLLRAIAAGRRAADPSARVESVLLEARLASRDGHKQDAQRSFERGVEMAEVQERPEVLARALVDALSHAEELSMPERVASHLHRLRELHGTPEQAARLRVLGVPAAALAALAPCSPGGLGQEVLVRLEESLAGAGLAVGSARALSLLRERVACLRAGLVSPQGCLVDLAAPVGAIEPAAVETSSLAAAVAARVRLLGRALVLTRPGEGSWLEDHPEAVACGLGQVLGVPARSGLVLYLDRPRSWPAFSEEEVRFARAFVERLSLEPARTGDGGREPAAAGIAPGTDLGILGDSVAVRRLRRDLAAVAAFDIPVCLFGESGTGKELAARAIHRLSRRRGRRFEPLNCAAVPEGLVESELFGAMRGAFSGAAGDREGLLARADGGILFLDEVGELAPSFQAKLLRVVELGEYRPVGATAQRRVDVRIVCATHRDMEAEVQAGRFRQDLYYRLFATARIELPALRERTGDVSLLVAHFVEREAARNGLRRLEFDRQALAALEGHSFPGNVRELEYLVIGLFARCPSGRVGVADLPAVFRPGSSPAATTLEASRRVFERCYLVGLLERHRGNRTHAARAAGVARQTLVAMLKRHGLERGERAGHGDDGGGAPAPERRGRSLEISPGPCR